MGQPSTNSYHTPWSVCDLQFGRCSEEFSKNRGRSIKSQCGVKIDVFFDSLSNDVSSSYPIREDRQTQVHLGPSAEFPWLLRGYVEASTGGCNQIRNPDKRSNSSRILSEVCAETWAKGNLYGVFDQQAWSGSWLQDGS